MTTKMQLPLIVDDFYEAVAATVAALGGFKKIGAELRPEMPVDTAGRWLADCCNAHRDHELKPQQLAVIRKMARVAGIHILTTFELREAGYADPQPLIVEDEKAKLQREFVNAKEYFAGLLARMERLA